MTQLDAPGDLAAQKAARLPQHLEVLLHPLRAILAQQRYIDIGIAEVTADRDPADRDHAQAWILDLALNQHGQLFLQLITYPVGTLEFAHASLPLRLQRPLDLDLIEYLDLVADLNIVVVLDADTALHAVAHFLYVILEAAQ